MSEERQITPPIITLGKIAPRPPHERPYPQLHELYQPDVIERLQAISRHLIAEEGRPW